MQNSLCAAIALVIVHTACSFSGQSSDAGPASDAGDAGAERPARIILFVGDGLGPALEVAASQFAHGQADALSWHALDHHGEILPASFSGLTDSAASATAMATGALTYNGRLALDRDGRRLESILERASRAGLATGIVTTANVTHATVAAFTAHTSDRYDTPAIAAEQTRVSRPEVMLGGGRRDFDMVLRAELAKQGAVLVETAAQLEGVTSGERLVGLFADDHFPYVRDRVTSLVPDLPTMTMAALDKLAADPDGFVLVVEGARIDRACHDRFLEVAIEETLELDAAVRAARTWAAEQSSDVTLLVVADHETGGLDIITPAAAGELPNVSWRWGEHTNRRVSVYGSGPATRELSGAHDPRIVFSVLDAALEGREPVLPERVAVANGVIDELRLEGATQNLISDFGASGRLDRIVLDADQYGITLGVEGTFSMASSSVVVLVDRDFETATGASTLASLSAPSTDPVETLLARLTLGFDAISGFAPDYAAVSVAGIEDTREQTFIGAGWRALRSSDGMPLSPPLLGVAINYDDRVRASALPAQPRSDSGMEVAIELERLYPELGGSIPIGAEIAIAVVMTSVLGGSLSNQALPSFEPGFDGELRGVVVIELDVNRDGVVDLLPRTRVVGP